MLRSFLVNIFILVTFLFLTGVIDMNRRRGFLSKKDPYYGLLFGTLGLVLMNFSIPLEEGFIMDLRHLGIIIPYVYLGSLPGLLSSAIIVASRLLITSFSRGAVVAALSMSFFALILHLSGQKIALKPRQKALLFNVLAIAILAFSVTANLGFSQEVLQVIFLQLVFSMLAVLLVDLTGSYIFRSNKLFKVLRQREMEMRTLLSHLQSAVIMESKEGIVLQTNPLFCQMFDLKKSTDQITGIKSHQLLPLVAKSFQRPERFQDDIEQLRRDAQERKGLLFTTKDGQVLELEYAPVFLQEEAYGHFWHFRDLTRRVSMERSLEEANEKLRALSALDGLTGIANRRSFDERFSERWAEGQREKTPLSLVMMDIDHFKAYNDTYGHPAGDEVLKRLAALLKEITRRPTDLCARYGGEEFVLLLPKTSADQALGRVKELQERLEKEALVHKASPTHSLITLSLGVASVIPRKESGPSQLLEAADQALYEAKRQGRNRVVTATFS